MGTNADKHARQKANREAHRAPEPSRNRALITVAMAAAIALIGVVVWQISGDGTDEEAAAGSPDTGTPGESGDAGPGSAADSTPVTPTPCPPVDGSAERVDSFEGPPLMCIDPASTTYSAVLDTTVGSFTIELDPEAAPETVNNFVVLARYRYYEGVPFHRVVPDFVIQAGDGDGTPDGSNDIGYTIDDELPDSPEAYVDYSVAMANAGPGTGASQFFVVLPGGGTRLGADYSLFGRVSEGTGVVDAIGDLGGPDESPSEEVLIEKVTVVESPR